MTDTVREIEKIIAKRIEGDSSISFIRKVVPYKDIADLILTAISKEEVPGVGLCEGCSVKNENKILRDSKEVADKLMTEAADIILEGKE